MLFGALRGFSCSTTSCHRKIKITALPYCLSGVQCLKYILGLAAQEGSDTAHRSGLYRSKQLTKLEIDPHLPTPLSYLPIKASPSELYHHYKRLAIC